MSQPTNIFGMTELSQPKFERILLTDGINFWHVVPRDTSPRPPVKIFYALCYVYETQKILVFGISPSWHGLHKLEWNLMTHVTPAWVTVVHTTSCDVRVCMPFSAWLLALLFTFWTLKASDYFQVYVAVLETFNVVSDFKALLCCKCDMTYLWTCQYGTETLTANSFDLETRLN